MLATDRALVLIRLAPHDEGAFLDLVVSGQRQVRYACCAVPWNQSTLLTSRSG